MKSVCTIQISELYWVSERGLAERRTREKAKAKKWPLRWRHELVEVIAALVEEKRGLKHFSRADFRFFLFADRERKEKRENSHLPSHLTFRDFSFSLLNLTEDCFVFHLLSDRPCGREFVIISFSSSKTLKSNYKFLLRLLNRFSSLQHREEPKFKNSLDSFSERKAKRPGFLLITM